MKVVTFGEIMLRLSPPGFKRLRHASLFEIVYGGGEANVAASLTAYGVETEFVSRLPANDLGDACLDFLHWYGIGTAHILRGGERLGVYFLEAGAAQRGSKVIYDRENSSFAGIQPGMVDWAAAFDGADWFHWTGITPAVSPGAAEACLEAAQTARQMGLNVSCDLNYRKNLWRWGKMPGEVMPELVRLCDVAIGNEEDAEKVFGIHAPGVDVTSGRVEAEGYRFVAQSLVERFPTLHTIAITLRGSRSASHNSWSAVLWNRGDFYTGQSYEILPIVDRVGGGDAFSGGLIYGLRSKPGAPDYALRFGIAASCLKHSLPGDFNAVTVAEVERLMTGDASGRVSR
jgi:2-dehydro-3-deoxygluconokinase